MHFKTGQKVWVICDVKDGMFPSEKSVRFELPDPNKKIISGFVPKEFVKGTEGTGSGRVAVFVTSPPENGKISILFPGEILTSTNPVRVAASWLSQQAPQKTIE